MGSTVWAGAGLFLVVAIVVYRLTRCQNLLQATGELTRVLGVAFFGAWLLFLAGAISLPKQWPAWPGRIEGPWSAVAVIAPTILTIAIVGQLRTLGTKLHWWGSWNFPNPVTVSRHPGEDGTAWISGSTRRSKLAARLLWLVGWTVLASGALAGLWGFANLITQRSMGAIPAAISAMATGSVLVAVGRALSTRAQRRLVPVLSPDADLPEGSYVLYLRQFDLDQVRTKMHWLADDGHMGAITAPMDLLMANNSEERQISHALRPVGPMVGVGIPGERLPPAGAMRIYLPQDGWQPTVTRFTTRARLVMVTLAATSGTMWELAEAQRLLPPQRILIIMPSMSQSTYETIREQNTRDLCDIAAPARNPTWNDQVVPSLPIHQHDMDGGHRAASVRGLIRYAADWQPTFTRTSGANGLNLFHHLRKGLRPILEQLSAYEQHTGRHCG